MACTIFEFFADGFDFIIVLIEKGVGIGVIDQASDHARYATMIKQVFEEELRLVIIKCLSCNGSGDTGLLRKLRKMGVECILACASID